MKTIKTSSFDKTALLDWWKASYPGDWVQADLQKAVETLGQVQSAEQVMDQKEFKRPFVKNEQTMQLYMEVATALLNAKFMVEGYIKMLNKFEDPGKPQEQGDQL